MRKLAVVLLLASVFSAPLSLFVVTAQREGNAIGEKRLTTV
jgi:hypothetical protein